MFNYYIKKKQNLMWVNYIKLLSKKCINGGYLDNGRNLIGVSYRFHSFIIFKNESAFLKRKYNVYSDMYDITRTFDLNILGLNASSNTFFMLSSIYKTFFKKGFFLKSVKIISETLKKINLIFFNSCFLNHFIDLNIFFNNKKENEEERGLQIGSYNLLETYSFKYFDSIFKDIYLSNNINNLKNEKVSIENNDFLNFFNVKNSSTNNHNLDLEDDELLLFNKSKTSFFLNIFFKYFFFCDTNFKIYNMETVVDQRLINFYTHIYNKNNKNFSITFYNKYFLLLVNNFKKLYAVDYLKLLNNFFSLYYFIPKILNYLNFFFRVQFRSLGKKMKKILKNKRKFKLTYVYVKPYKRMSVSLHYFKKYILIADGKNYPDKLFNVFLSVITEDKASWISQIYYKQQLDCVACIKLRR